MKSLEEGSSTPITFRAGESLAHDMEVAKLFHGCSSTSEVIRWALEYYVESWREQCPEKWEAASEAVANEEGRSAKNRPSS
jgi:metal-responsive CopG/Arc/MetJ family transcriptional regulator